MENVIKILYITTDENNNLHKPDRSQGDYMENLILLGLRKILKENCVEYPRKKILYHDFSTVSKDSLHGKGFSLYYEKMEDIPDHCRDLTNQTFDVILYGTAFAWGMEDIPELEKKCKLKFYIDGHDLYGHATAGNYIRYSGEVLIGNQAKPSFKEQLILEEPHVYPTGVGLPESRILPIDLSKKCQLYQKAYPRMANFEIPNESNRAHYIFTNEEDYYEDMSKSWFGLSCRRGGWDAMRNYEIIAAGSVLLFRDHYLKPRYCSPGDCPAISYSTKEELQQIMSSLIVDNKPTDAYINKLNEQRDWLINNATEIARAKYILSILEKYVSGEIKY